MERASHGKAWQKRKKMREVIIQLIRRRRRAMKAGKIRAVIGRLFGKARIYVGLRWSIVTCSAFSTRFGSSVMAVAPLPIMTLRPQIT